MHRRRLTSAAHAPRQVAPPLPLQTDGTLLQEDSGPQGGGRGTAACSRSWHAAYMGWVHGWPDGEQGSPRTPGGLWHRPQRLRRCARLPQKAGHRLPGDCQGLVGCIVNAPFSHCVQVHRPPYLLTTLPCPPPESPPAAPSCGSIRPPAHAPAPDPAPAHAHPTRGCGRSAHHGPLRCLGPLHPCHFCAMRTVCKSVRRPNVRTCDPPPPTPPLQAACCTTRRQCHGGRGAGPRFWAWWMSLGCPQASWRARAASSTVSLRGQLPAFRLLHAAATGLVGAHLARIGAAASPGRCRACCFKGLRPLPAQGWRCRCRPPTAWTWLAWPLSRTLCSG